MSVENVKNRFKRLNSTGEKSSMDDVKELLRIHAKKGEWEVFSRTYDSFAIANSKDAELLLVRVPDIILSALVASSDMGFSAGPNWISQNPDWKKSLRNAVLSPDNLRFIADGIAENLKNQSEEKA